MYCNPCLVYHYPYKVSNRKNFLNYPKNTIWIKTNDFYYPKDNIGLISANIIAENRNIFTELEVLSIVSFFNKKSKNIKNETLNKENTADNKLTENSLKDIDKKVVSSKDNKDDDCGCNKKFKIGDTVWTIDMTGNLNKASYDPDIHEAFEKWGNLFKNSTEALKARVNMQNIFSSNH